VNRLAICNHEKLIATCTDKHVSLWLCVGNQIEWILDIQQPQVTEIVLFFDYIAFLSILGATSQVYVLQLHSPKQRHQSKTLPQIAEQTISDSFQSKKLNSNGGPTTQTNKSGPKQPGHPQPSSLFHTLEFSPSLESSNVIPMVNLHIPGIGNPSKLPTSDKFPVQILGPQRGVHSIRTNEEGSHPTIHTTLLLYRRFVNDGHAHSIHLIPEWNWCEVKPHEPPQLKSLMFFVSTRQKGFLYDVLGAAVPLVEYTYMSDCSFAYVKDGSLYTLTDNGLMISVMRTSACQSEYFPFPPMWVGAQPEADLAQMISVGRHVVLFSKTTEAQLQLKLTSQLRQRNTSAGIDIRDKKKREKSTNKQQAEVGWKISVNEIQPIENLYDALFAEAHKHKLSDPNSFYQILVEAHFLLLSRLCSVDVVLKLAKLPKIPNNYYTFNSITNDRKDEGEFIAQDSEIQQQIAKTISYLQRSYSLLGDVWVTENQLNRACLCYAHSDASLDAVAKKVLQGPPPPNIFQYLNSALFTPKKQTQHPASDPLKTKHDDQLGDLILNLYASGDPKKLGKVMLSSFLINYSPLHAITLLQKSLQITDLALKQRTQTLMALSLVYFRAGDNTKSLLQLSQIVQDPHSELLLVKFCVDNPVHLQSKSNEITFATVLKFGAPWALLQVLISLQNTVEPTSAISILNTDQIPDKGSQPNPVITLLTQMIYLEAILLNKGDQHTPERTLTISTPRGRSDMLQSIARFYVSAPAEPSLQQFASQKGLSHKWLNFHRKSFIDTRFPYLHQLDPLSHPKQQQKLNYRYKLEGLFCSHLCSEVDRQQIFDKIILPQKGLNDLLSFRLLRLTQEERLSKGIRLMIESNSGLILSFATVHCHEASEWKLVLELILEQAYDPKFPTKKQSELVSCYCSILEYLSGKMELEPFIRLLPEQGDLSFFYAFHQILSPTKPRSRCGFIYTNRCSKTKL